MSTVENGPIQDDLIARATQAQRWRDFVSHLTAYLVMNSVFVTAWALNGRGYFWPIWSLLGWGVGLSFQHFHASFRRPISAADLV